MAIQSGPVSPDMTGILSILKGNFSSLNFSSMTTQQKMQLAKTIVVLIAGLSKRLMEIRKNKAKASAKMKDVSAIKKAVNSAKASIAKGTDTLKVTGIVADPKMTNIMNASKTATADNEKKEAQQNTSLNRAQGFAAEQDAEEKEIQTQLGDLHGFKSALGV